MTGSLTCKKISTSDNCFKLPANHRLTNKFCIQRRFESPKPIFFAEEEQKRADLSAPVVFKKPAKKSCEDKESRSKRPLDQAETEEKAQKAKKLRNKSLLSFDDEDNSE